MSTACWGTNNCFDCAWITFGYGSRWDMIGDTNPQGFWLSLEALKVFLIYDLPAGQHLPYDEESEVYSLPPSNENKMWYTEEEWAKLDPRYRARYNGFHISHPEGEMKSLEWFIEAEKVCGQYRLANPDRKFEMPSTCCVIGMNGSRVGTWDYPFKHQIAEINPIHGKIIESTYERNDIAVSNSNQTRDWLGGTRGKEELEAWTKET